ncbi:hypothetical protein MJG53_012637 [Ovis ammon polii x Ovis aries]|uniref:Uncharacterized protein n=1 Tax=Ovis ammon polii x Ovis aries TaxID=2918886 RepID=A0ACB9ULD0_9CETA|nr:hypothetical protein MJG53_012637 [Ovis ammon polii x Ovis aries]
MPTRATSPEKDEWGKVCCLRHLPQLCSPGLAFSLLADMGIWRGVIGDWSMSIWCICFAVTLIISIVEFCDLLSWFSFYCPSLDLHPAVHHTALVWCVAVYSICFILGAMVLLLKLSGRECRRCILYPIFQLVLTLFSILLYISTVILWPLYQFNEEFRGQSQRSSVVSCSRELAYDMCL